MASILGKVFNGLLCQRNLLYKQTISNIGKYGVEELFTKIKQIQRYNTHETCNMPETCNKPDEYLGTLDPLLNADNVSHDLCLRVRNDMINKHSLPEDIVDSKIIDICMEYDKFNIVTAYINCFEHSETPINVIVLSKYLKFYRTNNPNSIFEKNLIIHICNRIQKEIAYLPESISQNSIIALSKTPKWQEAFTLIKRSNLTSLQCSNLYQHLITAAYNNKCPKIAESILFDLKNTKFIHCNTNLYRAYLNYYLQKPEEFAEAVKKIFIFWSENYTIPIKTVANLFVDACIKTGLKANYVTINKIGKCSSCKNQLTSTPLPSKEFNKLVNNIIPKMIVGGDIFRSTTPIELKTFKSFLHTNDPFDIVIDSLNVSSASRYIPRLKTVLKYSAENYKNVLVIARVHMYYLRTLTSKLKNVKVFYLKDTTKDDPFMLYAALNSGINTKFVTTDHLRQHYHKLYDENLQKIFKQWQYTHQYYISPESYRLIKPLQYDPFAQENNGCWHIPYREDSLYSKLLHKPVNNWLCIDFSNIKHLK